MEALAKKNENLFNELKANLFVEANIKHAREHIRIPLDGFDLLLDQTKGKEIQAFNIVLNTKLGSSFSSNKKFITSIEKLIVDYYAGIVQHLTTWSQPAPKL